MIFLTLNALAKLSKVFSITASKSIGLPGVGLKTRCVTKRVRGPSRVTTMMAV